MKERKKYSEDGKKKLSIIRKKMYAEGRMKSWNKGLTKKSDIRLKKCGLKISKIKKKQYAEGTLKSWNKGMKSDELILHFKTGLFPMEGKHFSKVTKKQMSTTKIQNFKNGNTIQWAKGLHGKEFLKHYKNGHPFQGKHLTSKHKKNISKGKILSFKNGNTIHWAKGLHGADFLNHYKNGQPWNKGKIPSEKMLKLLRKNSKTAMLGRHHSIKTKNKMSTSGIENWKKPSQKMLNAVASLKIINIGRHQSKKTRQKRSTLMKKFLDNNPEYKIRLCENLLKSKKFVRPTSLEKNYIHIFKKFPLLNYTGDRKYLIDGNNPDFVSHEMKLIIEVRNTDICRFLTKETYSEYKTRKIKFYNEHGWNCLVFNEKDLNQPSFILQKIEKFYGGIIYA